MLIQADARHIPLRDGCVQCVVTSPPYFNLRDYDADGQIGMEDTPDLYIESLRAVFREVWRVLKADGCLFLNIGDSYSGSGKGGDPVDSPWKGFVGNTAREAACTRSAGDKRTWEGIKAKDLVGIPWMLAFALRADGWYLRSDIIWHKKSPMPESVRDRPTRAHEYLFLLAKQEKYYYNADAIAEPCSDAMFDQVEQGYDGLGLKDYDGAGVQNPSSVKARIIERARVKVGASRDDGQQPHSFHVGKGYAANITRNKRSVWTLGPEPFSGWVKTSRQVRVSWDESDDDTTRTTSPDCPVHGDRAVLAAKALCGERATDSLSRIEHSYSGHVATPLLDCAPTGRLRGDCSVAESLDSSGLSHAPLATPRSSQSRRTGRAPLTTSPYSAGDGTLGDIDGTSALQPSSVEDSRTLENSTPDQDGRDVAALAETLGCTVGKCSCEYYKIITENMSHFATMPEKLVEPCILAGSRFGDLVFDPFSGSGTVLAVAERLGRRGVGTDLNPAYHALAKKRTAQRGLRFEDSERHPAVTEATNVDAVATAVE